MPEIDDVRIAPPRGDTKGKSIANEEEEQNPNPSASKDTSAAPSGSGKSTRGYGDLPTKFHEFTSQRSQGLPDIISNPESVNKIMYATRLLCDVVEEHVVDNETNYSQFSQPVDLASSSQIEREKYEHPDSTTWDNTVLEKLERHRKGLLPPVENAVDIRYIVVPIHGENHWSVVLIHVNDARDACVIYHMDSVKTYHDHAQIGTLLSTWIELGLKLNMRTTIVATGIHLQKNSFDCGVHVLYIITKLIEAEKEGKLLQYLENGGVPTEWGTPEIVSNFLQELRDWFDQLSE
ncbi:hypothetical protein R1sor_019439 [Riccia sorocarpa]|uniref:Ubiquitin-like protease family profile domain-containing protein n=1 Tax=Riccia sorocarpa TaxID=122646 RepID=A0ABD3ICP2_9MARC